MTVDTGTPLVDIGNVIQLAVAPVFLLSGIGIVLTVLTNRLARLVDRARKLEEAARSSTGDLLEERRRDLVVLADRARLMNHSITLSTCSALLVAVVVVLLFLGALLDFNATLPVAGLFILAMLSLIGALLLFLREVFLSIKALKIGV
jgi:F0F1-type ATP synthase assembly protein I